MKALILTFTLFLCLGLQASNQTLLVKPIHQKSGEVIGDIRLVEYAGILELRGSLSELEPRTNHNLFIHDSDICRGDFDSDADIDFLYENNTNYFLLDKFRSGIEGYYSFEYKDEQITVDGQQYYIIGRSLLITDENLNLISCVVIE